MIRAAAAVVLAAFLWVTPGAAAGKPVRFTVSASGDLLMHQPLLDRARANSGGDGYDFDPFFSEINQFVEGVDLALCHLETPMGPGPPSTYPIFNTPVALATSVHHSGWDACSTASNHSNDQGQSGIDGTVAALNKRGVEHTGSFRSRRASRRPTIVSVRGVKVGFIAYTDATNGIASPHPWSLNEYDAANPDAGAEAILSDAKRARRAGADVVIVQIHWGLQYEGSPNSSQMRVAELLTRSKRIDVVVGQGPHVVQPIRKLNGNFVVFSEGNLVSNQSPASGQPAASQDGLIALLDFNVRRDRVQVRRVRYVPIWVHPGDYVVLPARPDAGSAALRASFKRTVSAAGRGGGIKPWR
jgi:poly-gamma-glutamate capsule biosynthesis protein CapA/YwtB (metallophosphatase superfamily)